jgi:hypothetical protein
MTALPPPPPRLARFRRRMALQLLDYLTVRPYPLDVSAWFGPGIGRMVQRMMGELGLRGDPAAMLAERGGVVEQFVPVLPRPTPAVLTVPWRLLRRRHDVARWTDDVRLARFLATMDDVGTREPASRPWAALFDTVQRTLAATGWSRTCASTTRSRS